MLTRPARTAATASDRDKSPSFDNARASGTSDTF